MWENKQTTNKSFVDLMPFLGSKMTVTLRKAGSATVTPTSKGLSSNKRLRVPHLQTYVMKMRF